MNAVTEQIGSSQKEQFAAALNFKLAASTELDAKSIADRAGLSLRVVNYARGGGKRSGVSLKSAEKIAAVFDMSYLQFLELGENILRGRMGLSNVEPAPMPDRSRLVPLVSMVRAGAWTEAEGVEPASAEEWVECSARLGPRAFALRVEGDSMEPEFWEGEYVVVDPDIAAASGDFVVAALDAGEATLKRYRREAGRDFLAPENARYPHMDMTDRDWRIIGRVMEKGKKY